MTRSWHVVLSPTGQIIGRPDIWIANCESHEHAASRARGLSVGHRPAELVEKGSEIDQDTLRKIYIALSDAHRDIGEWIQLARRQRDELNQNLGVCPTQYGIDSSEKVRRALGQASKVIHERLEKETERKWK